MTTQFLCNLMFLSSLSLSLITVKRVAQERFAAGRVRRGGHCSVHRIRHGTRDHGTHTLITAN